MCQGGSRYEELVAGPREGTGKMPSGVRWQVQGARMPVPKGNIQRWAWKGLW